VHYGEKVLTWQAVLHKILTRALALKECQRMVFIVLKRPYTKNTTSNVVQQYRVFGKLVSLHFPFQAMNYHLFQTMEFNGLEYKTDSHICKIHSVLE
jgi:hypothetical protein